MAGTASIEQKTIARGGPKGTNVHRITWKCLSSSGGGTGGSVDSAQVNDICGNLKRVVVFPDKGAVPTDSFDTYIYDVTGSRGLSYASHDLLASAGENLTNSRPTQLISTSSPLVAGNLMAVVRNAGVSKRLQIIAYFE